MTDSSVQDTNTAEATLPPADYNIASRGNHTPKMPDIPEHHSMPGMHPAHGYQCIPQETVIRDVKLARAYVPFQRLCNTYPAVEALCKGTLFPELFSPYVAPSKKQRPPEYE
jgi:hypothetical protein